MSQTTYVCRQLDANTCTEWVAQTGFLTELSTLSYNDINVLLSYTALLFATAWLYKRLSLYASRL